MTVTPQKGGVTVITAAGQVTSDDNVAGRHRVSPRGIGRLIEHDGVLDDRRRPSFHPPTYKLKHPPSLTKK